MIKNAKIHHVGIVFNEMERADAFIELLGLEEEYRGYVDAYQAWCIFIQPNGGSKLELIVPDGGNLREYNGGKGGIHHVAYEVEDVEQIRQDMADNGITLLEETAVPGAGDIMVNFMRPRDGKGVLVEFVQNV